MLDTKIDQLPPPNEFGAATADNASGREKINILGIVRRQFSVVLLFMALGSALGAAILLKAVPAYTAVAKLLIATQKIAIFQEPAVSSPMPMEARGAMESQVELLRSDEIAREVINRLRLWEDPRFIGVRKPSIFRKLLPQFSHEPPALTNNEQMQLALDIFSRSLAVDRVDITYVIEIAFASKYPDLAAQIANGVADAYIDLQRESEYETAHKASEWLESRLPELRAKSEAAQRAVVDYKNEHNIVETDSGQLINDQRVVDLNAKLIAARDDTLQAKVQLDRLSAISVDTPEAIANTPIEGDSKDGVLAKLRSAYFELISKEAELSAKYGRNNPAIVSLDKQKNQVSAELVDEFNQLREASRSTYAVSQAREAAIKQELDVEVARSQETRQARVKLHELEASARAYQDLYNTFINRYNASLQQAVSPVPGARIIERASALNPNRYGYKKTTKVAAIFPVVGTFLGLGIALLRELLAGRSFRTSKSVQSRLHVACIGVLPRGRIPRRSQASKLSQAAAAARRIIVRGDRGISWIVLDHPLSRFSEGVRSVKLAIDLDNRNRSTKIIGFTSAVPNEGKSTVALAVGQLMARNGAAVIVVDCDLRNPSLTRSVAPDATKGIMDVVAEEAALEDVVWKDASTQLAFLPSVPRPGSPDPPTILASIKLKQVFDALRAQYDYVIVDLSPLAPVIDVSATIELIEAYVLVIEWGRTSIDVVEHALSAAPYVSDSVIGAVLNKAEMKTLTKYDPYVSGYYFGNSGPYLRS